MKDPIPMKCKSLALLGLFGALALSTQAGLAQSNIPNTGNGPDNPDWVEEAVETPPAFSTKHLIQIDMPVYATTKAGFDPDTLVVGADGVVRYVMVLGNASGTINAVFEGIRCTTDEVKTYARFGTSGKWSMVQNPAWKAMTDNMPSKHALSFARQGACVNYASTSKAEVLAALKTVQRPDQGQYRQ
jgi:hypothetical protein